MSRSKKKKKNLSKEELLRIVFATHHKYEMGSGRVGVMAVGGGGTSAPVMYLKVL